MPRTSRSFAPSIWSDYRARPVPQGNQHAVRVKSSDPGEWRPGTLHEGLSWTHYRLLLKEDRRPVRDFYEIESIRNGWSARQLERQMASLLFERLAKSRDKKGVLALANEEQLFACPHDVIKDQGPRMFLSFSSFRSRTDW
jgi:DUF1016 N-terminal domain